MGLFRSIGRAVSSAASAVGNAVASVASTVGNAIEGAANVVVNVVENAVNTVVNTVQGGIGAATDWLCKNAGSVGCAIGNAVGGIVDGFLQGVKEVARGIFNIIRVQFGIIGSIFRLDLPGILKGIGGLLVNIFNLGITGIRFFTGGYIVGGIIKKFKRATLIRFVDRLVDERFGDDPDRLDMVRRRIGLEGGRFGFRLPFEHRLFVMDSGDVELWRMHEEGVLDLYAMAGLLSFDSFSMGGDHPNTAIKSVDADGNDRWWPVSRWTISRYLKSKGEAQRLRVYAMSRRATVERLSTTSRKLDEIGVILEWDRDDGDQAKTTQEITESEYDFNTIELETLLARPEYDRPPGVNCDLVALAGFKLDGFGRVAGRNILECEDFPDDCATPGRTDRCCNTVNWRRSSGVIYRDIYPAYVFQYVLAHEIGHYLGLCHCGHDGFQNVMFRPDVNNFLDVGLLSYYWDSEPHFSLEDGKNSWRFIVDQLAPCLTEETEVSVPVEIDSRIISSRDSCAIVRDSAERGTAENNTDAEVEP